MDIDTNKGTGFFIAAAPKGDGAYVALGFLMDGQEFTADPPVSHFRGELTNPDNLEILAGIIRWAEANNVDLKFNID